MKYLGKKGVLTIGIRIVGIAAHCTGILMTFAKCTLRNNKDGMQVT